MEACSKDWLDEAFLRACLSGGTAASASITISHYEVRPGVAPGNNYGSEILRVTLTYRTEETDSEQSTSLIIKAPTHNTIIDFMNDYFGTTEFNFYYKFLPKVEEISAVQFAPQSYFSLLNTVVVLEDLRTLGFEMADRHKQLDLEHCRQYFRRSAKLHAAGIALLKKYPELSDMFPSMQQEMLRDMEKVKVVWKTIFVGLKCLVRKLEEWNLDEYNGYTGTIKKFVNMDKEKFDALVMADVNLQKSHFKSFIHGDCWTTNMMFKYDSSGTPVDIRLLDFQVFNYEAVVSDVTSFTWMSANNDVLEHHLEELYRMYCDTLNADLEELHCDQRFSYERLQKEVLERSLMVLSQVGVFLPLTQSATLIDNSTMFSDTLTEDQFMGYYQGKHFMQKFPKVLKLAANQGIFDYLETRLQ